MNRLAEPRSLQYFILRCCERLRLTPREFHHLPRHEQISLLAYSRLRQTEEPALPPPGSTEHLS